MVPGTPWDNRWVIPYNTWLLKKYSAQINVEACTNAKPIAYLYIYIFKRSDSANISITVTIPLRRVNQPLANRKDNKNPVEEMQAYYNARWIAACKAAWRILGQSIGEIKPPVQRLQIYLENQQKTVLDLNKMNAADLQARLI